MGLAWGGGVRARRCVMERLLDPQSLEERRLPLESLHRYLP